MELIWLDECDSTNSEAGRRNPSHGAAVIARRQTAGRGQRGNSWESEPGKNLTFSLVLRPEWVEVARQFCISQAVSLAIVEVLERHLGEDAHISIKWPNDIYVGDKKICGILIENSVSGKKLARCIVGVGINVNQTQFVSDAPNPVSMAQIAGREFSVEQLAAEFVGEMLARVEQLQTAEGVSGIAEKYFARLWRGDGYYPYRVSATGEELMARIHSVGPMGHIILETDDGHFLTFAFKQITPIMPN